MSRKLDIEGGIVDLSFGAGGLASAQLTHEIFMPAFSNPQLDALGDAAVLSLPPGRLAVSTDSHVVSPLIFPGGDVGSLSVHGSINDVAMMGAAPFAMTAGFIIEEGLPLKLLKRIVESMGRAATDAGIAIVSGDTKVVKRGEADGLYINTTCIGTVSEGVDIGPDLARAGDVVLVSGSIGNHGATIMAAREELGLATQLESDSRPLHDLVAAMVESGADIHAMRDPTRGGLATALNEIAEASKVGIEIDEMAIPVREEVRAVAELLGLDPLYFACEGRVVAICAEQDAGKLLAAMRAHPKGGGSAIIGRVTGDGDIPLILNSASGGRRIVAMLTGEQMPRIC